MKKNPPSNDAAQACCQHRIWVRMGQAIMAVGALVALSHWIAHVVMTGNPPGIQDLLIGYPTAAVLMITGAIFAGRATGKTR